MVTLGSTVHSHIRVLCVPLPGCFGRCGEKASRSTWFSSQTDQNQRSCRTTIQSHLERSSTLCCGGMLRSCDQERQQLISGSMKSSDSFASSENGFGFSRGFRRRNITFFRSSGGQGGCRMWEMPCMHRPNKCSISIDRRNVCK